MPGPSLRCSPTSSSPSQIGHGVPAARSSITAGESTSIGRASDPPGERSASRARSRASRERSRSRARRAVRSGRLRPISSPGSPASPARRPRPARRRGGRSIPAARATPARRERRPAPRTACTPRTSSPRRQKARSNRRTPATGTARKARPPRPHTASTERPVRRRSRGADPSPGKDSRTWRRRARPGLRSAGRRRASVNPVIGPNDGALVVENRRGEPRRPEGRLDEVTPHVGRGRREEAGRDGRRQKRIERSGPSLQSAVGPSDGALVVEDRRGELGPANGPATPGPMPMGALRRAAPRAGWAVPV